MKFTTMKQKINGECIGLWKLLRGKDRQQGRESALTLKTACSELRFRSESSLARACGECRALPGASPLSVSAGGHSRPVKLGTAMLTGRQPKSAGTYPPGSRLASGAPKTGAAAVPRGAAGALPVVPTPCPTAHRSMVSDPSLLDLLQGAAEEAGSPV